MKTIPYYERVTEALSPLRPRPMKTYRGKDITDLERIEVENLIHETRCYETDKLEKIITTNDEVPGGKLIVWATTIMPRDDYPLPIFSGEIIQTVAHVSLRADFIPLADCVLDMGYFEKYIMPMEAAWKRCMELEGAGIERHAWARLLASPFYAHGRKFRLSETIEDTVLDITVDYLKLYAKLCSETEKADPAYMTSLNARKRAMREIYTERDPAKGPLEATVGKETSHKLIELLF
jgi:hypothetical protein